MDTQLVLAELARQGTLHAYDLDVVMVALGYLSYDAIAQYLAHCATAQTTGLPEARGEQNVAQIAQEITTRICGCQYHDGGQTELIAADCRRVHLRIAGACVHCPQIRYTMKLLEKALRFRAPQLEQVEFAGTRFDEKMELPTNRQLTMAHFMKKTGLTFADLDRALAKKTRITDDDLMKMALLQVAIDIQTGKKPI
jgi:Fe-S cluster biogenesis protein NfuA